MKIFVLGVPHTRTTTDFTTCPFTMKAWLHCQMLHGHGHEVIHLGVEGSNPACSEHVSVVPEEMWQSLYGHPGAEHYNTKTEGKYRPYHELYAANVRTAIQERVSRPWEAIIACPWGDQQVKATADLQQFTVECGIGYRYTCAQYRVFVSYAWLHFHLGLEKRFDGNRWYDVVIPNAVAPDMFDFRPHDKKGYFVFLGRLNEDKGVTVAIDVARRAGRLIKIVGQGNPTPFLKDNPHASYLPPVGIADRRKLLAEADALLCPTRYVEPLGNVALEAQVSGTPVICTDWGGFTESVLHGQTGYRCRTMEQFVWAAKNVDKLQPSVCRQWVLENYSPDRVATMFEEHYQNLLNLDGDGWYREHPQRDSLDWLSRSYPTQEPT